MFRKVFNNIFNAIMFLFFVCYWPIEKGSFSIPVKFYIDSGVIRHFDFITIFPVLKYLSFIAIIPVLYYFMKDRIERSNLDIIIGLQLVIFFMYITTSLVFRNPFYTDREKITFILEYILLIIIYLHFNSLYKDNNYKVIMFAGITNSVLVCAQCLLNISKFNSISDLRLYRYSGGMIDPIFSSILISVGIIIINYSYKDLRHKLLIILMAVACLLTGSRTWIIIILIYIGEKKIVKLLNNGYKRWRNKRIDIRNVFIIIMCINILITSLLFFRNAIISTLVNYTDQVIKIDFNSEDMNPRAMKWELSKKLFLDNKIAGAGTETYRFYETGLFFNREGTNPHNIYLQLLCENGIIGFFIFIVLITLILVKILQNKDYIRLMALTGWLASGFFIGLLRFDGLLIFILIISGSRQNSDTELSSRAIGKVMHEEIVA